MSNDGMIYFPFNIKLKGFRKIKISKPDKARAKKRRKAYTAVCEQEFLRATRYGDEIVVLRMPF
jgi:hypothetical protein